MEGVKILVRVEEMVLWTIYYDSMNFTCDSSLFSVFFPHTVKKIGFALWPDIMLIICYWQEIFFSILPSDSEAIL